MAYEEDFQTYGMKDVEIDGRKFKIKEFTPAEVDRIADKCTTIVVEDGAQKTKFSIEKQNIALLVEGVVDAPYEMDGKKWKEMPRKTKEDIFANKLKADIRKKLLAAIGGANNPGDVAKK